MNPILLLLILATATLAKASPFLVCDAVPASPGNQALNVVSYVITGLATTAVNVQATINADGSQTETVTDYTGSPTSGWRMWAMCTRI